MENLLVEVADRCPVRLQFIAIVRDQGG